MRKWHVMILLVVPCNLVIRTKVQQVCRYRILHPHHQIIWKLYGDHMVIWFHLYKFGDYINYTYWRQPVRTTLNIELYIPNLVLQGLISWWWRVLWVRNKNFVSAPNQRIFRLVKFSKIFFHLTQLLLWVYEKQTNGSGNRNMKDF